MDRGLVQGRMKIGSRGSASGPGDKRKNLGPMVESNSYIREPGSEGFDDGKGGNFSSNYNQFIAKLKEEKKKFKDFTNN